MPEDPFRNDGETIACPVCQRAFTASGRQRYCSAACRQAAWRLRHPTPLPSLPTRAAPAVTVYQCSSCETRYLGTQYCPERQRFCRRLGPGGPCPHCEEPVALADLLPTSGTTAAQRSQPEVSTTR